jgi:hypothetical protein
VCGGGNAPPLRMVPVTVAFAVAFEMSRRLKMRRFLICALAVAGMMACGRATLAVSPVASQQGVRAIVGTYDCVTHDSSGKTWRFRSVNAMWGAWLRAATTFSPQNGQPKQVSQTFVGFDSGAKRWNIVSIDAGGSYYTRSSGSRDFTGSQWTDGYPADGGKAVIGTPSLREYTFDFTGPKTSGHSDISHTVCTRP